MKVYCITVNHGVPMIEELERIGKTWKSMRSVLPGVHQSDMAVITRELNRVYQQGRKDM